MAYSPPKTTAPMIPATTRNRKRLGIWRNCSLACMVQTQGDAIMSPAMGFGAHAEMPRPDPARPCGGKETGNRLLSLGGFGKAEGYAPQMIRFGARGKSEEAQAEAIRSIRTHLGAR